MQTPLIKRWMIAEPLPGEISEALQEFSPVMRQILYNRGIETVEAARLFLDAAEPGGDPFGLRDMEPAVERLLTAVERNEPIAVYGDYDVDGVTATTLLVQVLRALGGQAIGYIPNRFDEGYGLNDEALQKLKNEGIKVVVTVDCGIRSPREAEFASSIGLDLIISDHHHPKDDIPHAVAVICQKRSDDEYPDKNLAGVGLAYKIAQALCQRSGKRVFAQDWLDLVAVGTVADIVPLKGENRVLVRDGLQLMRTSSRVGLRALVMASGLTPERLTATDIGFGLGPRLNAAGRLESAMKAFDLLMTEDAQQAGLWSQQLDDQNRDRQRRTVEMQQAAETLVYAEENEHLVFAVSPDFTFDMVGLVGLVAAKLTELYYRPAIVGVSADGMTRCSCRSIPEFHITQALDECADLMVRHGGHAMAAGLTVSDENLPILKQRLQAIARRDLSDRDLCPVLRADLEIPLADLHPNLLKEIDLLQPTGQDNPGVAFVSRGLRVTRARLVGADNKHLKLTVTDGRITYDAIAFRLGYLFDNMPERVDLLYTFEVNTYQGRDSLQLNVRDLKPSK